MSFKQDIKNNWNHQDSLGRLLLIIVVVSLFFWLVGAFYPALGQWFSLPSSVLQLIIQPWSVVSYAFLHSGFIHLFWNVVLLYSFGRMVLNIFTTRQFYSLFFMGVIAGGLLFVVAHNVLPAYVTADFLIGASAGVYAVSMFACTFSPDAVVRVVFMNVYLKYIGYVLWAIVLLGLISRVNTGGDVAHLGGLLLGYYTALKMSNGVDVLSPIARFFTSVFSWFSSGPKKAKKSPMKTVYKNAVQKNTKTVNTTQQEKIDAILDKISSSGYESLTQDEKDFLFRVGKQ